MERGANTSGEEYQVKCRNYCCGAMYADGAVSQPSRASVFGCDDPDHHLNGSVYGRVSCR